MTTLNDAPRLYARELLGTRTFSKAVLAAANGANTIGTTVVPSGGIVYEINGQKYLKANLSTVALSNASGDNLQSSETGQTSYYSQPISTTVYYLVVLNAAGTPYVIQGTYAGQVIPRNGGCNAIRGTGWVPNIAIAGTYAPIGIIKVVNGTNAVFVPGTTNWDATGVTTTTIDVGVVPLNQTP